MSWLFTVQCERHEAFERIYQGANQHITEVEMPYIQNMAQTDPMAAASHGDAVLYQIRSACAAALGVVGAVTQPGTSVRVTLSGHVNTNDRTEDFVQISVAQIKLQEETTDAENISETTSI